MFSLINYLYIKAHSRFEGPAEQLAEALVSKIRELGGEVLPCAEVTAMQMENGRVQSLTTADGRTFAADCVVSSIHPQSLLKVTGDQLFTKASRTRLMSAPNNYSAYCVYAVLKEGTFPYITIRAIVGTVTIRFGSLESTKKRIGHRISSFSRRARRTKDRLPALCR